MGGERRTAGLLIIGDEILSAKVEDVNTRFLCGELRSIGWTVDKVGGQGEGGGRLLLRRACEASSTWRDCGWAVEKVGCDGGQVWLCGCEHALLSVAS